MDHLIRWIPKSMLVTVDLLHLNPATRMEAAAVITKGTLAVGGTAMDRRTNLSRKSEKKCDCII